MLFINISYIIFYRSRQITQKILFPSVTILSQVLSHVANYAQLLKKFGELFNRKQHNVLYMIYQIRIEY